MGTSLPRDERLDEACRLVGRFLKYYAIMEQAIDFAIGKLLGLEGGTIDIISANIPLAKKVDVLFSAEKFIAALPDDDRRRVLKETRDKIMKLNDDRVIVAHCPFEPNSSGGVAFRRVVTKRELKVTTELRSSEEIERACESAAEIAAKLEGIVTDMKPYEPKLDFSDIRNSMYLALL